MTQLINKGGFRERANRSRRYAHSENQQTSLPPHSYSEKSIPTHHETENAHPVPSDKTKQQGIEKTQD